LVIIAVMSPNTAFHKSSGFCKLPQWSKPQCSQAISSAALFLRPVHHFLDSGPQLQGVGYSSASGLPLLSASSMRFSETPVGETRPYRSYGPVKSVGSPSVGTVERTGLQRELQPLKSSGFQGALLRQLPSVSGVSVQVAPLLPQLPSQWGRGRQPAPHLRRHPNCAPLQPSRLSG
jgi:hypothetical protein